MQKIDVNQDGLITFEELSQWCTSEEQFIKSLGMLDTVLWFHLPLSFTTWKRGIKIMSFSFLSVNLPLYILLHTHSYIRWSTMKSLKVSFSRCTSTSFWSYISKFLYESSCFDLGAKAIRFLLAFPVHATSIIQQIILQSYSMLINRVWYWLLPIYSITYFDWFGSCPCWTCSWCPQCSLILLTTGNTMSNLWFYRRLVSYWSCKDKWNLFPVLSSRPNIRC